MYVDVVEAGHRILTRIVYFLVLMGIRRVEHHGVVYSSERDVLCVDCECRGELKGEMRKEIEITLPLEIPYVCYEPTYPEIVWKYNEGNYDIAIVVKINDVKAPVALWYKNRNLIYTTDIFHTIKCSSLAVAVIATLYDAISELSPPKLTFIPMNGKVVDIVSGKIYDTVEEYAEDVVKAINKSVRSLMKSLRRAERRKLWTT